MLDSFEIDPATGSRVSMEARDLAELVFTCAGAATAPLLRDHPGYTFPSEQVGHAVAAVFQEMTDLDVAQIPGYAGIERLMTPPPGVARIRLDLVLDEGAYEDDPSEWEAKTLAAVKASLTDEQRAHLGC